ncbi:WAS/WASL-interacting protein family member 1-like [Haliotis rufescens]|nr:WAS/WASL-interacting protein family member 1-like [Haliotis rufescens]
MAKLLSVNSTVPPPLPERTRRPVSRSVPDISDFEARFRFHGIRELPSPEPYTPCKKTYPSALVAKQPRESPPPPPPPRRQRPSLPAL